MTDTLNPDTPKPSEKQEQLWEELRNEQHSNASRWVFVGVLGLGLSLVLLLAVGQFLAG